MIAIDTNVLVRLLVGDDPAQARRARNLVHKSRVFVSAGVLLETEWVLRSGYALPPEEIARGFKAFLGLPNVTSEAPLRMAQALDTYEEGLDFADAVHIAWATGAEAFYTFDARLARKGLRLAPPAKLVPQ